MERVERAIYVIRGQKVMLDRDLADLYGVETRVLNQAVRRNRDRFPDDFMFSLAREEISSRIKHAPNERICLHRTRRGDAFNFFEQPRGPFELTSRSCGHFSGCGECWQPMRTWSAGSTTWEKSTTPNSK